MDQVAEVRTHRETRLAVPVKIHCIGETGTHRSICKRCTTINTGFKLKLFKPTGTGK